MDQIDSQILAALNIDARLSLKALAGKVGLSSPSVAERLRRLEDDGVIRGFTLDIDPAKLGYVFEAIVRVKPLPGRLHDVQNIIAGIGEISECDKVTGEDCFICRLHARDMAQLDEVLDQIAHMAESNTSIVKAKPVKRRLPPLG